MSVILLAQIAKDSSSYDEAAAEAAIIKYITNLIWVW